MNTRPPLPPFTRESAIEKVRLAEDGWNSRDPAKVALAYTLDTQWRNRAEFATNRKKRRRLARKWKKSWIIV
jgi:nuclear transport factor 2 (NTF2) superfamily protein